MPPVVAWRAPELSSDFLYANPAACPRLAQWEAEDIYGSAAFRAWDAAPAQARARDALDAAVGGGFPWAVGELEGPTLDCLLATSCSGGGLPAGVEHATVRAAVEHAYDRESFKLTYKGGAWAKLAMVRDRWEGEREEKKGLRRLLLLVLLLLPLPGNPGVAGRNRRRHACLVSGRRPPSACGRPIGAAAPGPARPPPVHCRRHAALRPLLGPRHDGQPAAREPGPVEWHVGPLRRHACRRSLGA